MGLLNRVVVAAVVIACIGASALLVGWAGKPNMSLLFSGLEPEEASQIVEKIRDADVPYELRAGGTTVLVPEAEVYALRLSLAGQGLVGSGNDSYRIIDNQPIGASPGIQRINYVRAVQGELARTIRSLDGVAACRVHISNPERRMFNRDEDSPSASVAVKMKTGRRLSAGNVSAIVHLVAAGAGGGLTSDNVVVVDGRGNVLSKGAANDGGAADFAGEVTNIELAMARKVEQLVEGLVGPGRVRARVTVEMTRKKVQTTTEESTKGAVVTETEKTSKTETPSASGAPGAKTTESTLDTTSVPSTTRTVTTTLPGEITSKSVAVVVDLTPPTVKEPEDGSEAPTPPKMPDVKTIRDQVIAALGLDVAAETATAEAKAAATDVLSVTESSMLHSSETGGQIEEAGLLSPGNLMEMLRQGSLGILVIGVLLVLRMFGGAKGKSAAALALPSAGASASAIEGAASSEAAGLLPSGEEGSPDALKASITKALQDNPEEVKRLFLSWAGGERGEA